VLGAGGRDLPDRQRTLWAAIGWSYELLSEEEREVFELMAVFSSARLPAIEAVGASLGLDSVLDALAGLVDKSLIRSDDHKGVQRFSMLLMIKEYAESLLSQNPVRERAVRKAHALHFAGFAHRLKDQLASSERESVLRDLESEIGNLRTAWRYWVGEDDLEQLFQLVDGLWALHEAKGWYWAAIELASDALEVLGRAEPSDRLATEELTLRTSFARALMAVRGYGPEVEAAFQKVLAMTEAQGQSTQLFPVLRSLATYYTNLMNFEQAAEIGKRLLEIGEQEQDDSKLVEGHYVRGVGLAFSGDIDRGLPHLDEAIRLYNPRLHSNRFRLGPITGVLARVASGMMLWQGGAIEEGINRIEKALALAREVDHPYSIAYGLWHNGYLALGRSRFEEALQRAGELSAIAEENDYPLWATLGQVLEGVSLSALGDIEKGLVLTEVGIQLYQGLTTPPIFWPNILSLRARVQAMAGNPERALELINEAIAFRPLPEMVDPEILLAKGDFLQMLPQPRLEEAEQAYLQTIAIANMRRQSLLELQARNHLVALRRALGRSPDGSEGLAVLYATFGEGLDEVDLVTSRELLAAKVKTG
jgi:predicted ATPase